MLAMKLECGLLVEIEGLFERIQLAAIAHRLTPLPTCGLLFFRS